MIKYIVIVPASLMENVYDFYYVGEINRDYCLKMAVYDEDIEFPECRVSIYDKIDKQQILTHHFLREGSIRFNTKKIKPVDSSTDVCLIDVLIEYPKKPEGYFYVDAEIIEIDSQTIKNLNVDEKNRESLKNVVNYFINGDYKSSINEICIFGEFIARRFAKKLKHKNFNDFGSAINALSHHKMTKQSKINYPFIGAFLWPIYYVRNHTLHAFSDIKSNMSLSLMLLRNLHEVLKYLVENGIKC